MSDFWDDAFEEKAKNTDQAQDLTFAQKAKARRDAEFQRGVRLGWWDADGNKLLPDDDDTTEADE